MDGELERYHKTNSTLDLTISNMRLKQSGLAKEVRPDRGTGRGGNGAAEEAGRGGRQIDT